MIAKTSLKHSLLLSTLAFVYLLSVPFAFSSSFKVVLDPGHGGHESGTAIDFFIHPIYEKDLNLDLAFRIYKILSQQGIDVILTRLQDTTLSFEKRAQTANESKADLFVSLHVNSAHSSDESGIETYVLKSESPETPQRLFHIHEKRNVTKEISHVDRILSDLTTSAYHLRSKVFACTAQNEVLNQLQYYGYAAKNRGVKSAFFYLLMLTKMPSILFEAGFASHPSEGTRLTQSPYRNALAEGLSQAILKTLTTQPQNPIKTRSIFNISSIYKKSPCSL